MKKILFYLLAVGVLASSCSAKKPENAEPIGENRQHYDWLIKECTINEKLIEESGYTKSASQLGRRSYCTEAEEMRERITGIADSNASGAKDF